MAINKIDFPTASTPSYTPSIITDYNAQNDNIEAIVKNKNDVSLTNWDTSTDAPLVATGSYLESDGVLYRADSDETISTTDASSGIIYLVFDFSEPEYKWVDTEPEWSTTYNGWYVSADRFTGHLCTWDGASSFTLKTQYFNDKLGGQYVQVGPNGLTVSALSVSDNSIWTGTYGSQNVDNTTWVVPAGAYMIASYEVVGGGVWFEVYDGSDWQGDPSDEALAPGFVVSDGTNYRIQTNGTCTVHYRKIW